MKNQRLSEALAFAGQIAPQATVAAGTLASGAIDGSKFDRLLALLEIGTLAGAATLNARFQHSSSSTTGWADVDATNCITSTFTSASNGSIGELELAVDQHATLNRYLRLLATTATSTWTGAAQVVGTPRYVPSTGVNGQNSADVVQTIVF